MVKSGETEQPTGYIVETMPFDKIEDYHRYLVVNYKGEIVLYKIVSTKDNPKHVRKMTKTFDIIVDDTEDVMD